MSRTAKIIATAVTSVALSIGSLGLAAAGPLHVDVTRGNGWCC